MTAEPVKREYATDSTFVRRLLWTSLRVNPATPTLVGLFLFLFGMAIIATVASPKHGAAAFVLPGSYIVLFGLGLPVMFIAGHRMIPVGSRYFATLRENTLVFGSWKEESALPYASYDHVRMVGDFVVLYRVGLRMPTLLPAQLFPDAEFEQLVDRVAKP